jgi:hypothetical protein
MATDITFADITNATTLEDGTGYFDKLMKVVTLHVESQYNAGKITGEGYASVYLGSMQSVLQQAQQFVLAEKLQEAQIDKLAEDILIAKAQVEIAKSNSALEKAKAIAAIDKEYGYNYTLDVDGNIIVGDDAGNGKLDAEVQLLNGQVVKIRDDSHNQEWLRNLQATKLQIDAEVSLYASKRLDTVPSIINGDESATASYATLVAAIPNI